MNIALIGFRGTGKSSTAKILAKNMARELFSIDYLIGLKTAKSISQFVREEGWEKFRDLESEILEECLKKTDIIIDCGGGIITREKNIRQLKKKAKVILLTANREIILERINSEDGQRPPLTNGLTLEAEIDQVMEGRREAYLRSADHIIDTSNINPDEAASLIINLL